MVNVNKRIQKKRGLEEQIRIHYLGKMLRNTDSIVS